MGNTAKKAVIYCRTACGMQHSALVQQADACRAYAEANGYEVTEVLYDSGQSGISRTRPGLLKLLDVIGAESAPQAVITPSACRISRNWRDCYELCRTIEERGMKVLFVQHANPFGGVA